MLLDFTVKTLFFRTTFFIQIESVETVRDLKKKVYDAILTEGGFRLRWKFTNLEYVGLLAKGRALKDDQKWIQDVHVKNVPLPQVHTIYIYDRSSWWVLFIEFVVGLIASLW